MIIIFLINKNLTKNSETFVYDVQNGVRGYNTSINRGAATFHPFNDLKQTTYTKWDSQYGGATFDCTNVNNITVTNVSGHPLYICGGNNIDFDAIGNSLNGTVINIIQAGASQNINVSGYNYVALVYYNDSEYSLKRYKAYGTAKLSGAQLVISVV